MKKFSNCLAALMACAGFTVADGASAGVIDSPDVAGHRTFVDTNTGRTWLDMDNFFDRATGTSTFTGSGMMAAAAGAGFTVAGRADVEELLGSLPLTGGEWPGYASVMGYGAPRELIWGLYQVPSDAGWAYAYSSDIVWGFDEPVGFCLSSVACGNGAGSQDIGVWAYQTIDPVPAPETSSLLLGGLGLLGLLAWRRKQQTA